jgi:hypothetical protein
MEWQIPLVVSAVVFAGFMLWRMRPSLGARGGTVRAALRSANARLEKATTDADRALALADAGDVCARAIGRSGSAVNYYLRAMRADPASLEVVTRAAASLDRRPRALEALMWRRLGEPWSDGSELANHAALLTLLGVYDRKAKTRPKARAIGNLLHAMGVDIPVDRPDAAVTPPAETALSASRDGG